MSLETEKLLTFRQLAARIHPGVSPRTVQRWASTGLRICGRRNSSVYLEVKRVGSRLYTSWQAYRRFQSKVDGI